MVDTLLIWCMIWAALCIAYVVCAWTSGRKKLYLAYFLVGMAFGFYLDLASFISGYYSYPDFYRIAFLGIPLAMTVAEGFSVGITIRLFGKFMGIFNALAGKKAKR